MLSSHRRFATSVICVLACASVFAQSSSTKGEIADLNGATAQSGSIDICTRRPNRPGCSKGDVFSDQPSYGIGKPNPKGIEPGGRVGTGDGIALPAPKKQLNQGGK